MAIGPLSHVHAPRVHLPHMALAQLHAGRLHVPHPVRDHPDAARELEALFWSLAIEAIALFALLVAIGAYAVGDVLVMTIVLGALAVLWLVRAWLLGHAAGRPPRDPRRERAFERRGF